MDIYRYFINISYLGTAYNGWQWQPGKLTVQSVLEEALSTILQEKIKCTGAGRTDSGVHASYFVAHFDSAKKELDRRENLLFRLNRYLPADISVAGISKVRNDAHARFDAISRSYEYRISLAKDPFNRHLAWYRHGDLDLEAMNQSCQYLMQYTDFTSFSKLHTDVKTNNCTITDASWRREENMLIFSITADRFLRNMVRAIVGTMVEIGSGRIRPEEIKDIIEAMDRARAGKSARAEGLSLVNIKYPGDLFNG